MASTTRSSSSGISNSFYSYVCVECGELFLTAADLKDHEMSIHSGHRIECEQCGAGFRSSATFGGHICQLLLSGAHHVVPVSGRGDRHRSLSLDSFIEYSVTSPSRLRRSRRLSSQTKQKSTDDVSMILRDEKSVDENRFIAPSILNIVSIPNSETEDITEFDSRFDKPDSEQNYSGTISSPRGQIPLVTDSFAELSIDDGTSTTSTSVILDSCRKRRPDPVMEEQDYVVIPNKMPKKSDLEFSENDESLMRNFDEDDDDGDANWKRILLGESFVYFLSQVVQQKQQQNISVIGNAVERKSEIHESSKSIDFTTNSQAESGKFRYVNQAKNLVIKTQIPIVISESDSDYLISHSALIPKVGQEKSSDFWLLKASTSTFVPDGPKGHDQLDHDDDGYDEAESSIPNCLKPNKSQWNCYLCFHLLKEGTPTELQTHLDEHIENCRDDEDRCNIFNFTKQPEPIEPVVSHSSSAFNLLDGSDFRAPSLEIPTNRFQYIRMPDGSQRRVTPDSVYEREMMLQEMERLAMMTKRRTSRRTVSWG